MKNNQIYGIGNILLDEIYSISKEDLQKNDIEKGTFQFVDFERIESLRNNLSQYSPKYVSGGAICNSLASFSALGGAARMVSSIGLDQDGEKIESDLNSVNLKSSLIKMDKERTGVCLVTIENESGERAMSTNLGASAFVGSDNFDKTELLDSEYLLIEGYLAATDSGKLLIEKAIKESVASDIKIILTLSDIFIVNSFKEFFTSILNKVDIIVCNENEAQGLTDTTNPKDAIRSLSKTINHVVITCGEKGAVIYNNSDFYDIEAKKVEKVIDTTGAGDMFLGVYLYGYFSGLSSEQAANNASHYCSLIIQQLGARLNQDYKNIWQNIA